MNYYDYINWTAVHIMQISVGVITIINLFLIKRECE